MVIEKVLSMLNLKNNFFIEIVSPGEAVQTTKNGHFSYWKGFFTYFCFHNSAGNYRLTALISTAVI